MRQQQDFPQVFLASIMLRWTHAFTGVIPLHRALMISGVHGTLPIICEALTVWEPTGCCSLWSHQPLWDRGTCRDGYISEDCELRYEPRFIEHPPG